MKTTTLPDRAVQSGRQFCTELGGFLDRVKRSLPPNTAQSHMKIDIENKTPSDMSFYTLAVVSPTSVSITPRDPSVFQMPGLTVMQAVVEDGKWRIDYGDSCILLHGTKLTGGSEADDPDQEDTPSTGPQSSDPPIFAAITSKDQVKIKSILKSQPDQVNVRNAASETPLIAAAASGDRSIVEYLVAHGADVSLETRAGRSALDAAMDAHNGEIVRVLKRHGAKPGSAHDGLLF
jgi:ankyrin repeat protein